MERTNRTYLGDGVYAERSGEDLILFTLNRVSEIHLEPTVFKALIEYCTKLGILKS